MRLQWPLSEKTYRKLILLGCATAGLTGVAFATLLITVDFDRMQSLRIPLWLGASIVATVGVTCQCSSIIQVRNQKRLGASRQRIKVAEKEAMLAPVPILILLAFCIAADVWWEAIGKAKSETELTTQQTAAKSGAYGKN